MNTQIGPVRIVGTGLIGASIGLALRGQGVPVTLEDTSPTARALARDLGAGEIVDAHPGPRPAEAHRDPDAGSDGIVPGQSDDEPRLVVVAAPPDVTAEVVLQQLRGTSTAVVTDVASVKAAILEDLRRAQPEEGLLDRYVGSHPMAGKERSGGIAATGDLFEGRPWVLVPHQTSTDTAIATVASLAARCGAVVTRMDAATHDAAVAAVSHLPQLAASLVAARLRDLPPEAVGLAGQGLRDVTRIAASDPALWTQILAGNAGAVRRTLQDLRDDVDGLLDALTRLEQDGIEPSGAAGARAVLARAVADGNAGHARIPGKHGTTSTRFGVVTVVIPDRPGSLAHLFADIGDTGINLEDLHIEHGLGSLVGIADLMVIPGAVEPLRAALVARGWSVRD